MNADIQSTCPHRWIDISIYEVPERARYVCMNCRAQWEGEPGKCPCHPEEKRSAWATEKPTKPGIYWWKSGDRIEAVRIRWWIGYERRDSEFDRLRVYRFEYDDYMAENIEQMAGEWAGPLEPPA